MPAKARRVATRTALLGKLQDGEVVIADLGTFQAPSARTARKILTDLGAPRRALIVIAQHDDALWKSFRNFPGVAVRTADEVCAHDLVAGGLVIAQAAALEMLTLRVGRKGGDA
jgi:large subunit ribosomal protein L4